jgi:hypothetical protein
MPAKKRPPRRRKRSVRVIVRRVPLKISRSKVVVRLRSSLRRLERRVRALEEGGAAGDAGDDNNSSGTELDDEGTGENPSNMIVSHNWR